MEYGSEFHARANEPFERAFPGFVQDDWQLVRSGRDALKALAGLVRGGRVLLPALCCESMIVPFALNGCEVGFYRLREDLRGDETDVRDKLADGALLLYMPYFGIRPFSDAFLRQLKSCGRGILLAEDRTQDVVVPRREDGFVPDATLASLRKWAALPEGGMLRTALPVEIGPADSFFGDMRQEAMEEKARYLESWEPSLKQDFLQKLHTAEATLDEKPGAAGMSEHWRRQLERLDFDAVYRARRRNILYLRDKLEPLREAGKLRFLTQRPEDSTLYLPLLVEDRNAVQRALAERGIYCPVIWPEPEQAAGVCPVSHRVTEHILCLPCDQRYGESDMDFYADCLFGIM